MPNPPANLQASITIQSLTDDQMAKFYELRGQNKLSFNLWQGPQGNYPQAPGSSIQVGASSADNLVAVAALIKTILVG
jgi:hypothetical protein